MNELLCHPCATPLRHDPCRDEMICVSCGNVYRSEMMHDRYYENSPDERMNAEVRRALRDLHNAGFDTEMIDVDVLQRAACDVFQMKPLGRREAVAFALCDDFGRNDDICRVLRTSTSILHTHSASSAASQFAKHVSKYAFDIMDKLDVHRRYRQTVREHIETKCMHEFVNPFAVACMSILSTVPEVGDAIFRIDKRFTKNMYAKYNERH